MQFTNLIFPHLLFLQRTLPLPTTQPKENQTKTHKKVSQVQRNLFTEFDYLQKSYFLPTSLRPSQTPLLHHKFRQHSSSSATIKFSEVFAERNLITIHQQEVPSSSLHFRRSTSLFIRKAKTFQLKQVYLFIIIHLKLKANQELISLLLVSSF